MSYNVYFSDPKKAATPIVVEDGTKNSVDSSLTLIGKNAAGYAQAIATNFIHILENHASDTPPSNPIEGQIWYDNATQRLKINDSTAGGANWKPASGIYQQDTEPAAALVGDIWVDTGRSQLFITTDGVSWTLVGPSYSSSLKSGSYPEVVKDKFGNDHTIIKQYVNGNVIEIISQDAFVPQQIIEGFDNIQEGINLNTSFGSKLNATAYAAERILVTKPYTDYILGNNFVRSDISSSIKAQLNVRDGLTIGADPTFVLQKESSTKNIISNNVNGGQVIFRILKDNIPNDIVTIDGNVKRVGINTGVNTPQAELDVRGDVRISGSLVVATNTLTGAQFNIAGPAVLDQSINVAGTSTFSGVSTFKTNVYIGQPGATFPNTENGIDIVLPLTSSTYNIGNSNAAFRNIYSKNFWGDVQGNVYGTAQSLSNTSSWAISGHLTGYLTKNNVASNFKGEPGNYIFDTRLSLNAITSQTEVTKVLPTDELQHIVVATSNTSTGIAKISKANFLSDLYEFLVPAGTILPYAGLTPPTGWILCDGAIVDRIYYPNLYAAIGKTYGATTVPSQFKIPDLRGRMIIGYDNMSNQFDSSPSTAAGRVPGANKPDGNLAIQGLAPIVTGGSNTATITSASGPYGVGATTDQISSVMNPYFAFNYIIKT